MLKIRIFSPGKTKAPWLESALKDYEKRLSKTVKIHWKNNYRGLEKENNYCCLDPEGKSMNSLAFSKLIYKIFEKNGSKLNVVIGDAHGICESIKIKASHVISLSKLTFTHQLSRLILLEQLYRAIQIEKGKPYHK